MIYSGDRQRGLLEKLVEELENYANKEALEGEFRNNLAKHGIPDKGRAVEQAKLAVLNSAHLIHHKMLELQRGNKVDTSRVKKGEDGSFVAFSLKKPPPRKNQIQSLKDAAASGSKKKWAKAWKACSDDLRAEIEAIAVEKLKLDKTWEVKRWPSGNGLPGSVPAPETILPLLDELDFHVGGRPLKENLHSTIAFILDERYYIAQASSWGIDQGGRTALETPGIDLVCFIFDLYGLSKEIEDPDVSEWKVFETSRKYRECAVYAKRKICPIDSTRNVACAKHNICRRHDEDCGGIDTLHPGYLGSQDTFYVVNLKGVGRIYQQTYVDTYSKVAHAKLYTTKTPTTAVDILNDKVLPFYKEHDLPVLRILTDRGTEYCGRADKHEFQLFLATNDIDHTKTKVKNPKTNGICEHFRKTILQEFYQVSCRKKVYASVDELQVDLDGWINFYNTKRTHQGKMCCGRTPFDTMMEGKKIWKEKFIN